MTGAARILISGATGFVGRHLRRAIVARWPGAVVLGMAGVQSETGEGIVFVDLLDRAKVDAVVAETRPDVVVHLAAQASVAASVHDQGDTWAVNVSGSLNLASAVAARAPQAVFLFVSSSEVYGASFAAGPALETTPLRPLTPYARSKALAERVIAEILPPSTRLVVARPFNHTGPGQRTSFVLPSFAAQVAEMETGRKPRRLEVGNLAVSREFLDVRDVVEAYLDLIDAAPRLPLRFTCNIASGEPRLLSEHVEALRRLAKVKFDVVVDPKKMRPVDLPVASGDPALLRAVTGFSPKIPFDTTLADLLDAARETERARAA